MHGRQEPCLARPTEPDTEELTVHRFRSVTALAAAGALMLAACEADEDPISPDPEGLEEPADDPEGVDAPLEEEPEEGDGAPAVDAEGEGQLTPDDEDDEDEAG